MRTWIAFCLQMASKFLLDALQGQMRWSTWICFGWRWDVMPKAPKIIFCGPFLPKFQLLSSELHDFNWQKGMKHAKHHYWERSIKKQRHHPCSIDGVPIFRQCQRARFLWAHTEGCPLVTWQICWSDDWWQVSHNVTRLLRHFSWCNLAVRFSAHPKKNTCNLCRSVFFWHRKKKVSPDGKR